MMFHLLRKLKRIGRVAAPRRRVHDVTALAQRVGGSRSGYMMAPHDPYAVEQLRHSYPRKDPAEAARGFWPEREVASALTRRASRH